MDKDGFLPMQLLAGGVGCDIVSGTGPFNARIGKITGVFVRANNSGIASVVEVVPPGPDGIGAKNQIISSGTGATGTRSYIGTNTLLLGEWYVFDHPVKTITPSAGSFIVYYQHI